MPITLPDEARRDAVATLQRFFHEERDETIGELQAGFLLDTILADIGPFVYNQAVRDVQASLLRTVGEIDATVFMPETAVRPRGHR